jgi:spore photoproduct lyase
LARTCGGAGHGAHGRDESRPYAARSVSSIETIVLARGSDGPGAEDVRRRVLAALPEARVERQPDVPPARVSLRTPPGQDRRRDGKRTLVLGEIGRVLDRNREPGMGESVVCYPYWHFNAVGNCPYDCKFCYLVGNRGNLKCPAIKVYTNLDDVMAAITKVADRASRPVLFYGSKLQDFVALDPLTEYSRRLVPFAAEHERIRLLFLTKSAAIDNFLGLEHRGHTILSWTLNAEPVIREYELGTPLLDERLAAARRAADAGYEVRFIFMPMIPVDRWRQAYAAAVRQALCAVRPSRITLGGICMYQPALNMMKRRPDVTPASLAPILSNLEAPPTKRERYRFRPEMRHELYSHMIECIREIDASIPISLCLETPEVWEGLRLTPGEAPCNCAL